MTAMEYTQQPDRWPHLLRMWGRDAEVVRERYGLRYNENDHVLAVWFPSVVARETFKAQLGDLCVVRSCADGDEADMSSVTWAEVWLRTPDGRVFTFKDSFGYGYPPDSVVFMYLDGNYCCDCNRALFIERHCKVQFPVECGETIRLARLRVYQVRPSGHEATIDDLDEPEA